MFYYLNLFLKSNFYDKLPKKIAKKIFKIFKIFFVETDLRKLPENNHPTSLNKNEQITLIQNSKNKFYKSYNTCSYLLEVFSIYNSFKKNIKILDFGANNIDSYLYLNKYLKDWEYIYFDLDHYNDLINDLIKENNFKNIKVLKNLSFIENSIDFTIFGSSIHYINNYQEILKKFIFKKSQFIIFSHTPFHNSESKKHDIIVKQVNIFPIINYAYFIYYYDFIKFMNNNGYELLSENKNNFIKFLNFKNFKNFEFIDYLDLIFIRKEQN